MGLLGHLQPGGRRRDPTDCCSPPGFDSWIPLPCRRRRPGGVLQDAAAAACARPYVTISSPAR